jgi:SulP family sulfate permease
MSNILTWNRELLTHFSLKDDALAAFTVAVVIIPQGMAYAMLSGLPPIYGLYAAFVPLLVYPFFGSSRQLSVGPVALVSIILFAGLSNMATPGSTNFIQLALLTSMVAGIIQIFLGIFRMGFLVNFLSEPVMQGFTSGAASIIIFSQLKSLLGIQMTGTSNVITMTRSLINNAGNINILTLCIGIGTLIFILGTKKLKKSIPAGLLAIMLGTGLLYMFQWHMQGVGIVGQIPEGLPSFAFDFLNWNDILRVFPLAFVICLISFIESLAIAKSISARHDHYMLDANKELFALGLAKLVGSFFQAFPNTGSFSRSAVNDEAGAKSGFSSIFSALIVGIILLFFTPLFYYLPKPVLGAIIISAVLGLLNFGYAKNLFLFDRKDFYVFLCTFTLTLLLGIQQGVIAGIILSIIMILQKTSKPHYAILGQLPGTQTFRNINRYAEAITQEDILIFRYDHDIYFGNAEHFFDVITTEINRRPATKIFILSAGAIAHIDSTGMSKFRLLIDTLKRKSIKLVITQIKGPVRDKLDQTGLLDIIGKENIYLNVNDALKYIQSTSSQSALIQSYATQSRIQDDKINR